MTGRQREKPNGETDSLRLKVAFAEMRKGGVIIDLTTADTSAAGLRVDRIDESEVLTSADEQHHVDKHAFEVPFVCGARNVGEALQRISEGAVSGLKAT